MDICTGYDKNSIHQLEKKDNSNGAKYKIYPLTYVQAVYDARNGRRLDTLLDQCNSIYVYWKGSVEQTRLALPMFMRRKGIIITYRNAEDEVITEKNIYDDCIADDVWGLDAYWVRITDALPITGNVTIGSNGNWFVNGEDTGFKAQGPKGENGLPLQPRLSEDKTKIEFTYDGNTWYELFPLTLVTPTIDISETVALEPGATPTVANVGDDFNVNLEFNLPKAPEVNVGSTTTIGEGNQAKVTNSGTKYTPVLNFEIPKGDTGRGINIKGFYPDLPTLQEKITEPAIGDVYCVGSAEPYEGYVWTNVYSSESQTTSPAWQSLGEINKDTTVIVNDLGFRDDVTMSQNGIKNLAVKLGESFTLLKDVIIFKNMAYTIDSGDTQGLLGQSSLYDCAIVKILDGSRTLSWEGASPNYVGFFKSDNFIQSEFLGQTPIADTSSLAINYLDAKYAIFDIKKEDNPNIENFSVYQEGLPLGEFEIEELLINIGSQTGHPIIFKNMGYNIPEDPELERGIKIDINFNCAIIKIFDNSNKINIKGVNYSFFRYFSEYNFNGNTELITRYIENIPKGAKYLLLNLRKKDNLEGYDDFTVVQDCMYNYDFSTQLRNIVTESSSYASIPYIWKDYYVNLETGEAFLQANTNSWWYIELPLNNNTKNLTPRNILVKLYCYFSSKPKPGSNEGYLGYNSSGEILEGTKYVVLLSPYSTNNLLDDDYYKSLVRIYQDGDINKYEEVLRDYSLTNINSQTKEDGYFIGNTGEYTENSSFCVETYLVNNFKYILISAQLYSAGGIYLVHYFDEDNNWLGGDISIGPNYIDNITSAVPNNAYYAKVSHNRIGWSTVHGKVYGDYFDLKTLLDSDKESKYKIKVHIYGLETSNDSNLFYIRSTYNSKKDIILLYYTNGNGLVSPKASYIGENTLNDSELMTGSYLVSSHSDSTAPFFNSSIYWHLFAQHGYVIPIINNTVNMTEGDVGAIWKDQLDRQYTIGKVTESYIYLLPVFTNTNEGEADRGWKTPNDTKPSHLTHVSGGTYTTEFDCTYYSITQLRPIMKSYNRKMLADGTEITKEGDYYCNEFKVSESQIGYDPATIDTWFPSPVLDGAQEMARFTWSYNFKGANCSVNTTVDVRRKIECQSYGACQQQFFLDKENYKAMFLIPKLKAQRGIDPSKPFNSPSTSSAGLSYQRNSTYLIDENDPVDRQIGYLYDESSNDYLVGMAAGLSLVTGDTVKEKRIQNIAIGTGNPHDRLGSFSPSNINKFYIAAVNTAPFADDGYNFPNTYFKEINYYVSYFDPAENEGQVYWYKDGSNYVIYAHCQSSQDRIAINLPEFMEGLKVQIVEKTDGSTLHTDVISNGKLMVSYDNSSNYIVVKTV